MALTWLLYRFRLNLSRAFQNSLFHIICPEAAGKTPVNPALKPACTPLIPALLAKMTKNFAGTGGEGAKISIDKPPEILYLKAQQKTRKRDDREKILFVCFREPPDAARRCGGEECHWSSSGSAETGSRFRRGRNSSPLPKRRDSSGEPDRCRKRAVLPMRVVPRKLSFRLFTEETRAFLLL